MVCIVSDEKFWLTSVTAERSPKMFLVESQNVSIDSVRKRVFVTLMFVQVLIFLTGLVLISYFMLQKAR